MSNLKDNKEKEEALEEAIEEAAEGLDPDDGEEEETEEAAEASEAPETEGSEGSDEAPAEKESFFKKKKDKKLTELEDKVKELNDQRIRQMAEFENFRKRTAKEKLELQATAGERIFGDMLSLIDDFERAEKAMAASDDVNALREGLDLIHKKFIAFLEKHDVRAIETENQPFDVDRHEAITTLDAGEDKKGQIIDCTQKGYTLGDKVIRYAKVVVGA